MEQIQVVNGPKLPKTRITGAPSHWVCITSPQITRLFIVYVVAPSRKLRIIMG
jgi:uroporphyrinogen-III synthase